MWHLECFSEPFKSYSDDVIDLKKSLTPLVMFCIPTITGILLLNLVKILHSLRRTQKVGEGFIGSPWEALFSWWNDILIFKLPYMSLSTSHKLDKCGSCARFHIHHLKGTRQVKGPHPPGNSVTVNVSIGIFWLFGVFGAKLHYNSLRMKFPPCAFYNYFSLQLYQQLLNTYLLYILQGFKFILNLWSILQ